VRNDPKPDLAYLFPIIDPASKLAKELRFDPGVENFTLPVLSELRKTEGVISSPTTALLKCDPTKLRTMAAPDLACFPWAIVEITRNTENRDSVDLCFCQAARDSAEALVMREELAERIQNPNKDALVIFSFTCVGSSVRFWFTCRNSVSTTIVMSISRVTNIFQENKRIEMRCIWATSLALTWGVYALRMVIENMREWVYRRVKPELARWIHLVRLQPEEQSIVLPPEIQDFLSRRIESSKRLEKSQLKSHRNCIKDDFYFCHERGCGCGSDGDGDEDDEDDEDGNLHDL
jgi:hypothetical protein